MSTAPFLYKPFQPDSGEADSRSAVSNPKLGENVFDVLADGLGGDAQSHRNLSITLALGCPCQHFAFARGKTIGTQQREIVTGSKWWHWFFHTFAKQVYRIPEMADIRSPPYGAP